MASRSPRGAWAFTIAANQTRNAAVPASPIPRRPIDTGPPSRTPARRSAGHGEHEPEQRLPAALRRRRGDLEIDDVLLRAADEERREWVRGKKEVRLHLRRVAEVAGEEVVQSCGGPALHENDEPDDHDDHERDGGPEPEPEDVREGEKPPEEDRQSRAPEIVGDDEPDRVRSGVSGHEGEPTARGLRPLRLVRGRSAASSAASVRCRRARPGPPGR